jgi:hypothetical protein
MKTAIEFLIDELKNNEFLGTFCTPDCFAEKQAEMKSIIDKAKEMEKQQVMLAHSFGGSNMEGGIDNFNHYNDNNHYYNEIYFHATNQ